MESDCLRWLEEWLEDNSDGEWEHGQGIRIESLDNPGWMVSIDIGQTPLAGKPFETIKVERGQQDWLVCRLCDGRFQGFGDTRKLCAIIETFRSWATKSSL